MVVFCAAASAVVWQARFAPTLHGWAHAQLRLSQLTWCSIALLAWNTGRRVCHAASVPHQPSVVVPFTDVRLGFVPDRFYNPSLVKLPDNQVACAIKHTDTRKLGHKTWWFNTLKLCRGSWDALGSQLACEPLQPWGPSFQECELDGRVRGGKVDSQGLGDVKLWVWPGRGVYAIFGTKPHHPGLCTELVVYQQWITQVVSFPTQPADDVWRLLGREPLLLQPAQPSSLYDANTRDYVMEKNWMPWLYTDPGSGEEQLMVTYMVRPHIVLQILPNGTAMTRHSTHNNTRLHRFSAHDLHGGPAVVRVPASLSMTHTSYYLGIMHHIERLGSGRIKLYRHFAFKFAAEPPFPVLAVSDELPLTFNTTHKARTAMVAFVSGLYLDPDTAHLHISYGAADIESRLLTISVQDMERLFTGQVAFRPVAAASSSSLTSSLKGPRTGDRLHQAVLRHRQRSLARPRQPRAGV